MARYQSYMGLSLYPDDNLLVSACASAVILRLLRMENAEKPLELGSLSQMLPVILASRVPKQRNIAVLSSRCAMAALCPSNTRRLECQAVECCE